MRVVNPETPKNTAALNGDAAALAVDRAIGELRRGRAIALADAKGVLVIAAIETTGSRLLAELVAASPAASPSRRSSSPA